MFRQPYTCTSFGPPILTMQNSLRHLVVGTVVGVVTHASKKPFRGTNVWNPPVVPAGNVVGVGQSLSCSDLERWNPNAA